MSKDTRDKHYGVECQIVDGVFVRGTVVDRVRQDLIVDFDCDGKHAEPIPFSKSYAPHIHIRSCRDFRNGCAVYAFLRPSRDEPRGWYPGKVLLREEKCDEGYREDPEWTFVIVDVKLSATETRRTVLPPECVCATASMRRRLLTENAFERCEIPVPSQYMDLINVETFPAIWEKETGMQCVQVKPNRSITVLRLANPPELYLQAFRSIAENLQQLTVDNNLGKGEATRRSSTPEPRGQRKRQWVTGPEEGKLDELTTGHSYLMNLPDELLVAVFGRLDVRSQTEVSEVCIRFHSLMDSSIILNKAVISCAFNKHSASTLETVRLLLPRLDSRIKHLIFHQGSRSQVASEPENYFALNTVVRILSSVQVRLETLLISNCSLSFNDITTRGGDSVPRLIRHELTGEIPRNPILRAPAVMNKMILVGSRIDFVELNSTGITGTVHLSLQPKCCTFAFVDQEHAYAGIVKAIDGCCGEVSGAMRAELKKKLARYAGDERNESLVKILLNDMAPGSVDNWTKVNLIKLDTSALGEATVLLLDGLTRVLVESSNVDHP